MNSSASEEDALLCTSLSRYLFAAVLLLICTIAFIGNSCMWLTIMRTSKLKTSCNILILNLSFSDILVTIVNLPLVVVTLLTDWIPTCTQCQVIGFLNMLTFVSSVMSLSVISINRYVYVCHATKITMLFNSTRTGVWIAGSWLFTILLSIPPLFGWAEYKFIPDQNFCFADWTTSKSYTVFMVSVCFGGPASVMGITNFLILREVTRSRNRLEGFTLKNALKRVKGHHKNLPGSRKTEISLAKSVIAIVATFIISWLMFTIVMFIDVFTPIELPCTVSMISLVLGFSNSAGNPAIYGMMNKNVRDAFLRLLPCCLLTPGDDASPGQKTARHGTSASSVVTKATKPSIRVSSVLDIGSDAANKGPLEHRLSPTCLRGHSVHLEDVEST